MMIDSSKLFLNDELYLKNYPVISGTDEAGRGPLAGPLVVSSVIFKKGFYNDIINDSKKLNEKKRNDLFDIIIENCFDYSISIVSSEKIDQLNILQATMFGMKETILKLKVKPDCSLIDGNKVPYIENYLLKPIVKGDSLHACIAAASILAKVTRDRIMIEYDQQFPLYGFAKHKGYPTKEHFLALRKHGITSIHRKSYKPVMQLTLEDYFIYDEKN